MTKTPADKIAEQRKKLNERLGHRKPRAGWQDEIGVPEFPEDRPHEQRDSDD